MWQILYQIPFPFIRVIRYVAIHFYICAYSKLDASCFIDSSVWRPDARRGSILILHSHLRRSINRFRRALSVLRNFSMRRSRGGRCLTLVPITGTLPQSSHGFLVISTNHHELSYLLHVYAYGLHCCSSARIPGMGARGPRASNVRVTRARAPKNCAGSRRTAVSQISFTSIVTWRFLIFGVLLLSSKCWRLYTRVCIILQSKSPAISASNDQFSIDGSTMDDDAFSYVNLDLVGPHYMSKIWNIRS